MLKYKRSLFLKKDFDGKKTVILNGKKYNQINENDFNHLLEKVKFGNSFSLPDRIIQDFISDGSIQPSLKNIKTFDNYDLENIIKPFKKKKTKQNMKQKKKSMKLRKQKQSKNNNRKQSKNNNRKQSRSNTKKQNKKPRKK
jgi:hypothetical protein